MEEYVEHPASTEESDEQHFSEKRFTAWSTYVVLPPTLTQKKQQTPWPLVRKRTLPTEQPPLVDEI
jgi:hypothetical protein